VILRNAGWDATAAGYFNFCVPLYVLLGFCENYKLRMVIKARRVDFNTSDNNCLTGNPATEPNRIIQNTMVNAARY